MPSVRGVPQGGNYYKGQRRPFLRATRRPPDLRQLDVAHDRTRPPPTFVSQKVELRVGRLRMAADSPP